MNIIFIENSKMFNNWWEDGVIKVLCIVKMVCMIYIIWFVVCVYFDCMGGWVYLFGVNIYIWCEYSSFILCVYSFIVWVYE